MQAVTPIPRERQATIDGEHYHQHSASAEHVPRGTAVSPTPDAMVHLQARASSDVRDRDIAATDDLRRAMDGRPRGNQGPMTNPQQGANAQNRNRFMRSSFGRALKGGMKARDRGPQSLQPVVTVAQTTALTRE